MPEKPLKRVKKSRDVEGETYIASAHDQKDIATATPAGEARDAYQPLINFPQWIFCLLLDIGRSWSGDVPANSPSSHVRSYKNNHLKTAQD